MAQRASYLLAAHHDAVLNLQTSIVFASCRSWAVKLSNYAVLGEMEQCSGDSVPRAGSEFLFTEMATADNLKSSI